MEPGDANFLARAVACVLLKNGNSEVRIANAVEGLAGEKLLWNNIAKQTVRYI